ncbi:tRNA (adenine(22)-N(1))-methyltransferase [Desulfosporosinus hippei]|uniref:tRNA (Adenine22-N1)-methyltransferase n=1 Tax=Desulfosporosinus hippei DSM 8344 TaxID=1121419 RepID=A0A1G7S4I6_9FIRM|nr:class I SAM-dependent methyltransferase [Desulfosporosinus hippei]SDG17937.1 tRNA (adenine22-N1)-methyltransferase [Desulfosporosinus hippei DSM 8344]
MTVSVSLGPRLQAVASLVPEGSILGDIGTDHAYLPIFLYETQKIAKAVAIDVHEGPYKSALTAVKSRKLGDFLDVRFGDGLMPLEVGEVNTLTLAGMGGRTMLEIFSVRPDIMKGISNLILQPQGAEGAVRLTLLEQGWKLGFERLVEEDERIYVVMAFSKESGWGLDELQERERVWAQRLFPLAEKELMTEKEFQSIVHILVWQFGPLILEGHKELLTKQFNEYRDRLLIQMKQMKKSSSPEIIEKIREVSHKLTLVEGLSSWQ